MRPDPAPTAQSTIVLAAVQQHEIDGIHDYTRHLAASLETRDDLEVFLVNPRVESTERIRELFPPGADGSPTILLQYNPFSFGRWGFAPWLPAKLWRLRRSSPRLRLGLVVHEMYVPVKDWRSALMGAWQRLQFFAVRLASDVVFTTIALWTSELEHSRPARPTYHLPVGSNLPDMRHARRTERMRLGADDRTLVLAAFGSDHPGRLLDYLPAAAAAVASSGIRTIFLNLGHKAPHLDIDPRVEVCTPGRLDGAALARHLAAADIYLAPQIDGISTRRTTLMSALQHGVPVVSTDGPSTDAVLREADDALLLTSVGDIEAFAHEAHALAADPAGRVRRGKAARSLYEREFDWAVVSSQLVRDLTRQHLGTCA